MNDGGPSLPLGGDDRDARETESFAYDGNGSVDALLRSFTSADANMTFLAIRGDGSLVFAAGPTVKVLGFEPSELVGTNVVDRLRPDEIERALFQLASNEDTGLSPGITRFNVLHKNGDYVPVEIFGADVHDGAEALIGIYGRSAIHQVFIEDILALLLQGVPRREALAPVCNTIQWNDLGSHLAISWTDDDGPHQVSTGIPDALGGGEGDADGPWQDSRNRQAELSLHASDLDAHRRALALQYSVDALWIAPVVWHPSKPVATVTIWTRTGGPSPEIHSYGMRIAREMTELILRWSDQADELAHAARADALTGLANRRAFFSSLASANGGGAVLYCDLDRFKPVNDQLGHAAGDELLRAVARRLETCVRESDLVARVGGDEFVVLCEGATEAEGAEVAERIRASFEEPFQIHAGEVSIGVSIGVAHGELSVDETLLAFADEALGEAKAAGRARVHVAAH